MLKCMNFFCPFILIFVLGYALVWLIVYIVEKEKAKKLNSQIR